MEHRRRMERTRDRSTRMDRRVVSSFPFNEWHVTGTDVIEYSVPPVHNHKIKREKVGRPEIKRDMSKSKRAPEPSVVTNRPSSSNQLAKRNRGDPSERKSDRKDKERRHEERKRDRRDVDDNEENERSSKNPRIGDVVGVGGDIGKGKEREVQGRSMESFADDLEPPLYQPRPVPTISRHQLPTASPSLPQPSQLPAPALLPATLPPVSATSLLPSPADELQAAFQFLHSLIPDFDLVLSHIMFAAGYNSVNRFQALALLPESSFDLIREGFVQSGAKRAPALRFQRVLMQWGREHCERR